MKTTRTDKCQTFKNQIYTYNEMKKRPGIYIGLAMLEKKTRIIVSSTSRPLFLCPNGQVEPLDRNWSSSLFTEVFEKINICFDNTKE